MSRHRPGRGTGRDPAPMVEPVSGDGQPGTVTVTVGLSEEGVPVAR